MNETKPNVNIDARYRTMLILWVALMMSIAMYVLLTFVLQPGAQGTPPPEDNRILRVVLAGVGTFSAVISFAVRSKLLQRSVEKQDLSLVQQALIVGCALCEVPALLGVVARFVLPGRDFVVLLALSAITMALHFPRREHLLAASYKDPSFGSAP